MVLIIAILTIILILVMTLPKELFYRRKLFIRRNEIDKAPHREEGKLESKLINRLIKLSRKLRRVIPIDSKPKDLEKIRKNIIYAGFQNKITADDFIGVKYLSLLGSVIYFAVFTLLQPSILTSILALSACSMAYIAPGHWLSAKAKRRQWAISKELPTILTSLAIVTDAGLNLIQGIEEIVKQNNGEFVKELSKTLKDIKIGISQKEAFSRLCERCDIEEINYFISAIIQGLEKGNSGITDILRTQSRESWQKRKSKAQELAEKASLKLFMPLLLLVFPAFIIFLMGPMIFTIMELLKG